MDGANNVRQFIRNRPKTCLFIGMLFVSGCVPLAILFAFVLGVFLFLLTCLLVIQGTVIGLSLTTLLVFLPGPLYFATFCTLAAYIVQQVWVQLRPIWRTTIGNLVDQTRRFSCKLVPNVPSLPDQILSFMNDRRDFSAASDVPFDREGSFSEDECIQRVTSLKAAEPKIRRQMSGEKSNKLGDKVFATTSERNY